MTRRVRFVLTAGLLTALMLPAAALGTPNSDVSGRTPLGLPPVPVPSDNPMTAAKIELGKLLYFDTRLSADGSVSCATCHDPKVGWAERRPTSEGIKAQVGGRDAPTVINSAYHTSQFWDGRAKTLEEQALGPIENPIEMGAKLDDVVAKLAKVPEYQRRFRDVFGSEVNKDGIAKAIAAFERTVLSGNSPFDRHEGGKKDALTTAQKRGAEIFMEVAQCSTCHTPPLFSNGRFYNAGVGADAKEPDEGRRAVTKKDRDFGKFRVPALRDVAATGPYFHDGSADTLEKAVRVMAGGGIDNPELSSILKSVREASLTEENIKDVVAFLGALSGEFPVIEAPKLP